MKMLVVHFQTQWLRHTHTLANLRSQQLLALLQCLLLKTCQASSPRKKTTQQSSMPICSVENLCRFAAPLRSPCNLTALPSAASHSLILVLIIFNARPVLLSQLPIPNAVLPSYISSVLPTALWGSWWGTCISRGPCRTASSLIARAGWKALEVLWRWWCCAGSLRHRAFPSFHTMSQLIWCPAKEGCFMLPSVFLPFNLSFDFSEGTLVGNFLITFKYR